MNKSNHPIIGRTPLPFCQKQTETKKLKSQVLFDSNYLQKKLILSGVKIVFFRKPILGQTQTL